MKTKRLRAAWLPLLFLFSCWIAKSENNNYFFEFHCPQDYWLDCGEDYWDHSKFGYAWIKDYHGKKYLHYPKVHYHLNSCGTGYFTRTWKVYDYHGNKHECTQTIHIGSYQNNKPHIYWPDPYVDLYGCNPDTDPHFMKDKYGYPHVYESDCYLISTSYEDLVFYFGGGCKKILRKWKVIDWCQYKPNYGSKGIWHYTQVIKITNSSEPYIHLPDDVEEYSYNCKEAYVHLDPVTAEGYDCDGDLIIKNDSPFAYQNGADASGMYPVGKTSIKFTVQYGCGYKKAYSVKVHVKDHSVPSPICYGTLSIPLMPINLDDDPEPEDGMLEIWASDFNKGSYHKCHYGELKFSFSSDPYDAFRIFTCEDVGSNELQMWVTDEYGNQSYCKVFLNVQNNSANIPDCEPDEAETEPDEASENENDAEEETTTSSSVEGSVSFFADGSPLANIQLELSGTGSDHSPGSILDTQILQTIVDSFQNQTGVWLYILNLDTIITETLTESGDEEKMHSSQITGENGLYSFSDLPQGFEFDLSVTTDRQDDDLITPSDVTALYKHAMGLEKLPTPYHILAADLDNSGTVNIADVAFMLDFILGSADRFPRNEKWMFVPQDYEFSNPSNPGPEFDMNNPLVKKIQAGQKSIDFVGIRIGDLVQSEIESRTNLSYIADAIGWSTNSIENFEARVYPNPFHENVSIEIKGAAHAPVTFTIWNLQGKKVHTRQFDVAQTTTQLKETGLKDLPGGLYYYTLDQKRITVRGKMIKSDY